MTSVVAFLTPIGHHDNLLVYGPGGYRFGDFVRVGAPLTLICASIVVLLAPMLWPCVKRRQARATSIHTPIATNRRPAARVT